MSVSTQSRGEPASRLNQQRSASTSAAQSGPSFRTGDAMNYKAWVAKAAKQRMAVETVDAGPLGAEDVEVAVEHCGLCHSDLSVLNNDWGISQYPAILGHEVIGRVTAFSPNAKGLNVGQRVGVGWNSGSCMHCHQCMSGSQHLCPQVQATIVGHRGGFATHIRAHWAWVIPLPEKLNFAEAGPLLCGGVTVFAPLAMDAKPTDRVGIVGIGGLGHMAVKFDWDAMIGTLAPNGRLHVVGAVLEPIPVAAFSLITGQRSVSGSPSGSPVAIETMLDFASRHNIAPQTEHFPMSKINEAFARLESGKARYRIVLDADF
jgi:uncharacterized zinc-type alcohol dehydrogenase-like protein